MASEADAERLVVLLEARIRDFEKNMAKASGTSERSYDRMRRGSQSATRQMEQDMIRSTTRINQALATGATKIGAYGKAFAGGLVGGIVAGGVAGVVTQIGQVANSIAAIGDEAKRAGVSARAFQEWKFVAEQNRIGIDQMTDGLKELNLRADEFISTGKGSAAEAFQRLGYGAEDLKKKLADPSALLLEIIGRLGKMEKAAQIRIADELFGGSAGERFVELLDQGEKGIRATIDEAHNLGVVIDDELIKKAAELDRRFNAIANTVGTALKSAIVSAADSLAEFIDGFNNFEKQRTGTLDGRMRDLGLERLEVEQRLGGLRAEKDSGKRRTGWFGSTIEDDIADAQRRMEAIAAEEAMIMRALDSRTSPMARTADRTWTPPTPPPGGFGGSGASRDKAAAQAEREAEAVRRLISELEEELRLVGATDTEKQISATLRRANVDAASKEGQQIADLVRQIESETEALERNKQAKEDQKEAIGNLFAMGEDALTAMLDNSQNAEDAIKRLTVQLGLAAAQAALLGTGPLAGLFGGGGGLFGAKSTVDPWAGKRVPGFATGTPNTGGSRGEPRGVVHGQEAVIPLPNGGRVPVEVQGSGGGDIHVDARTIIDAPNSDAAGLARLQAMIERRDAELPARIIKTIRDAKNRRAL